MVNGNPRNTLGYGGEAASLAREGADDALARCEAVLGNVSPAGAAAAIDAARLLMASGERPLKAKAVSRLRGILADPKTPDTVAIRACSALLTATGRRAYRSLEVL
jgi:hypothetical protein